MRLRATFAAAAFLLASSLHAEEPLVIEAGPLAGQPTLGRIGNLGG